MAYEKMHWPKLWVAVSNPLHRSNFEAELESELSPRHPLYGLPVTIMGRHEAEDEALFSILDFTGRLAQVHLTWSRSTEAPPWPTTEIFPSWEAWKEVADQKSN